MQYVVSDHDPDVRYGTRVTMAVTLTASNTYGFVVLGLPDGSGVVFGVQDCVCIPQYNMIFKYYFKGCADQSLLPYEQQTFMDTSIEAIDGDIILKFNNFLV